MERERSSDSSPSRRSRSRSNGRWQQWGRQSSRSIRRRPYEVEEERQRMALERLDFKLVEKAFCGGGWENDCDVEQLCEEEHFGEGCRGNFASLPFDVLRRVAGALSWPNLRSASMVCRSWEQALAPLREGMLFVHWGKRFKHGKGGVKKNLDKALESFTKGALRGCAAAMVDAGLMLWDRDRKEEAMRWYAQASELGDPAGQCNLGLGYLHGGQPMEAVKWLQQAAMAGHVRAQYSLALCFQHGKGCQVSVAKAAGWYLQAAEGGSLRAMYNTALCYREGQGVAPCVREGKKWMQRAAMAGHPRAQFEHGLALFAEGDKLLALVFLELATRAGQPAASRVRDVLLLQLPPHERGKAITCADHWQERLPR